MTQHSYPNRQDIETLGNFGPESGHTYSRVAKCADHRKLTDLRASSLVERYLYCKRQQQVQQDEITLRQFRGDERDARAEYWLHEQTFLRLMHAYALKRKQELLQGPTATKEDRRQALEIKLLIRNEPI